MKSLKMKLLMSFSILIVIAIVLGGMGTVNLNVSKNNVNEMISENYELVEDSTQMSEALALRVIAARGYVMYGDVNYKNEFLELTEQSTELIEKIGKTLGDDATYQEAVEKSKKWRNLIIEDVIPTYEKDGYQAALPIMEEYCQVWSMDAIDSWGVIKTQASEELIQNSNEIISNANRLMIVNIVASVIAAIVGLALVFFLNKSIVTPVEKITESLERISKNDLTGEDILVNSQDEILTLANSTNNLKNQLKAMIGSLSQKSHALDDSSTELSLNSERTSNAYGEVARTIEEIAQGATNQAEDTEAGARVVAEMEEVLIRNHEFMDGLNDSTERVDMLKNQGIESMMELVEKTNESQKASKEIQEVIASTNESAQNIQVASDMIESISDQTNLLALNAAIEAARAGEHGKGFAVVAEEIRKLAEDSNKFAEEIKSTVFELGDKTNTAVNTMDQVGKIVEEQTRTVTETQERFEGISDAIERIKGVIGSLNTSSDELDDKKEGLLNMISNLSAIAQENAAGSEEVSASVEEQTVAIEEIAMSSQGLANLSEELNQVIETFKI